jgi:hypothetical protein
MPGNSDKIKKLSLHLLNLLRMAMLVLAECLPKPKLPRAPKGTKDNTKRIELPVTAEVMKRQASQ